jgi:hypothetical protein
MSHIVSITTQIKDEHAVFAACRRLNLPEPQHRTVNLYLTEVTGLAVELPEWRYPVICDTLKGELQYDTFKGRWGDESQLHRFLQAYAVEKTKLEARKQGRSVYEQALENGSIRLHVAVAS